MYPLTALPTLLLCKAIALTESLAPTRPASANCLAMCMPYPSLSPQPPMMVAFVVVVLSTEKSQAHESKYCCLHFLATSRAIPALMKALRKAVSRVPAKTNTPVMCISRNS